MLSSRTPRSIAQLGQSPVRFYRISRTAHAQIFPPPGQLGRFDDPERDYRVLYTTLDRRAAFAESLQYFRRNLGTRAAMKELKFSSIPPESVKLESWAQSRSLLRYRLPRIVNLFNLRSSESIEIVADALAPQFQSLGIKDFDVSYLTGSDRRATQMISRWAYDNDHDGILFPSRLGTEWTCCAVFDRVRPRLIDRQPLALDDPDLLAVSSSFKIVVTG